MLVINIKKLYETFFILKHFDFLFKIPLVIEKNDSTSTEFRSQN